MQSSKGPRNKNQDSWVDEEVDPKNNDFDYGDGDFGDAPYDEDYYTWDELDEIDPDDDDEEKN